ncbi:TLC domain-containing protein 2-like [Bacillus rossius redtenbacheri]|uniref:TLC domain-containing protein 2-like n=1 Tax=Bacillus rossius redtenbacheri TaxID=93214 RepID=UPI002FDCBCF8
MDPESLETPNLGYVWASVSTVAFITTNLLLRSVVPQSARNTKQQEWKWRNTANSFLHSVITGIWACGCFWQSPEIRENLISIYTESSHHLLSVSVGYFIYDLLDIGLNHRKRSSYELMVHHIVVILCFGLAVSTRYYLGYGLMALLVEMNSIFLHVRQLLLIQGVPRGHLLYRLNSLFCLGTFVVFRIATLGWMTRWLVFVRNQLTTTAFTMGSLAMPIILVMNIVLFLRILNADYCGKRSSRDCSYVQQLAVEEDEGLDPAGGKDA